MPTQVPRTNTSLWKVLKRTAARGARAAGDWWNEQGEFLKIVRESRMHVNYSRWPESVCMAGVPAGGEGEGCKFISETICHGASERIEDADGSYIKCLTTPRSTCAIVGSSAHLLNATFGREIDMHEVVIRLNQAPAGGEFGKHVGSRTDVRFVNGRGADPNIDKGAPVCTFLHEPNVNARCGRFCWKEGDLCAPCTIKKASVSCAYRDGKNNHTPMGTGNTVILDHLHGSVARRLLPTTDRMITSGFKALTHALHTCRSVSVYGFGPTCNIKARDRGARYFGGGKTDRLHNMHAYDDELSLVEKLAGQDGPEGPRAGLPEGADRWVQAEQVTLRLPECVSKLRDIVPDLSARLPVPYHVLF